MQSKELNANKETLDKYNEFVTKADQLSDNKSWLRQESRNAFNLITEKEYHKNKLTSLMNK